MTFSIKNRKPGTSGVLTPYGEMDGLYFDACPEPDNFTFDFKESIKKIAENKNVSLITIDFDTKEDYYHAMNELRDFNDNHVRAYTTSKTGEMKIIIEKDVDLDEIKRNREK